MTPAQPALARVFVIEDHEILRTLIVELMECTPGFEVCGCSANAEAALDGLEKAQAQLALIDVSLPGKSGIDLARELRDRCPEVLCVMLSGHIASGYVEDARAAGAKGYVPKGNMHELVAILRSVLQGGSLFPSF